MMKLMKKHYMPILAIMIFVSVFLYQFFYVVQIPYIQRYSLQEIDYLNVLSYTLFVVVVVSVIFNVPLLLTIEIAQFKIIFSIHISTSHQSFTFYYKPVTLTTNIYKSFSVFRC